MSLLLARDRSAAPAPVPFLGQTLAALANSRKLAVVTVPAPVAPLETLLGHARGSSALLWHPPHGPGYCGIGHAAEIRAEGPARIALVEEQARAIWDRLEHVRHPDVTADVEPRLFGGFAFSEGSASAPPWRGFGDARFVLPTWCYGRHGDQAWLSLAVDLALAPALDWAADAPSDLGLHSDILSLAPGAPAQRWEQALGALLDALAAPAPVPAERPALVAVHEHSYEDFRRNVEDIRTAIAAGRCEKIVAARCSEVKLARAVEPATVLARLGRRHPDCYRFGYRADDAWFVGATPERLVTRTGDRVRTQALAGSIAVPARDGRATSEAEQTAAAALLASGKDRGEQALVVQAIERVIGPLCSELHVPDQPEIRVLRYVLHLETPIAGVLRQPTHVLALVAALHPTPAVGGVPTGMALRWIAAREPQPRGWYAAPVGWFDRHGDGEFAVAIRSGLLAGTHAYLYAGAGIVMDSDSEAELEETRLKLETVLDALGVEP
jgi:salicylate biosynthesis isochorismate synthase